MQQGFHARLESDCRRRCCQASCSSSRSVGSHRHTMSLEQVIMCAILPAAKAADGISLIPRTPASIIRPMAIARQDRQTASLDRGQVPRLAVEALPEYAPIHPVLVRLGHFIRMPPVAHTQPFDHAPVQVAAHMRAQQFGDLPRWDVQDVDGIIEKHDDEWVGPAGLDLLEVGVRCADRPANGSPGAARRRVPMV